MEFFIFQLVNFKMSTILIKIDLFLLLLPLLTAEILIDERRGLILEKCSAGHVYDQMGYFTMAFRMLAPDSNIGKPVVPKECATTKIPEWPDESFHLIGTLDFWMIFCVILLQGLKLNMLR